MAKTVGVRFRNGGKVYDFDPRDLSLVPGEPVVVETSRGAECGEVVRVGTAEEDGKRTLRPVLRRADDIDRRRAEENARKEREAVRLCQQRIEAHGLDMKLVDAEYAFDGSKILFNFTAEGRVDFRSLVKDLAAAFHTRIELHQIGVRDEAKKLGGIGICGQPFCCARFLHDFQPVSIKMAKEQGLSLNPTKISGSCGRLMCCLKYEQDTYEELWKLGPKPGTPVMTPQGRGVVLDNAILTGKLKVRLEQSPDQPAVEVMREDVTILPRDARGREAADAAGEGDAPRQPRQEQPRRQNGERQNGSERRGAPRPAANENAGDGERRAPRRRSRGGRSRGGQNGGQNGSPSGGGQPKREE